MTSTELTLAEMAPGGEAVGRRSDGLVVFVPGGTPGDRVEVALSPPKKGYAHGRLLRVLSPGADRVSAACPLAVPEKCGGCPLMPVARLAQLHAKESWVRRALRPSRLKRAVEILPILAPTADLGYRVRARLQVRNGRLGFAGARSHSGVAIAACPVLVPALDQVLFGSCAGLAPLLGEGATVQGLYGEDAGQGAVQLWVRLMAGAQRRAVRAALQELHAKGQVCGVLLECNGELETIGAPVLALGGDSEWGPFFGAADGFAQSSAAGHELLPRIVAEAVVEIAQKLDDGARVLELYAGSGNLTRALRRHTRELLCIEGDLRAAARLQALFGADRGVTVKARPVERELATMVSNAARFEVVVLDPPRTGAREALPFLPRLSARRLVYVSCDPMTLSRDLGELMASSGHAYVVSRVQPIDLMPHTAHVECVAIIDSAESPGGGR